MLSENELASLHELLKKENQKTLLHEYLEQVKITNRIEKLSIT